MRPTSLRAYLYLQNMVGPGEVDEDLQPETTEECSKYGDVANCLVYEVKPYSMFIEWVCHIALSTHAQAVLHTHYNLWSISVEETERLALITSTWLML